MGPVLQVRLEEVIQVNSLEQGLALRTPRVFTLAFNIISSVSVLRTLPDLVTGVLTSPPPPAGHHMAKIPWRERRGAVGSCQLLVLFAQI